MKPARIVVAGAGALGSIYGGVLTAAGADVVLIARGPHADALRTRPLTMHLPGREIEVRVRVAHEADGVPCFDLRGDEVLHVPEEPAEQTA